MICHPPWLGHGPRRRGYCRPARPACTWRWAAERAAESGAALECELPASTAWSSPLGELQKEGALRGLGFQSCHFPDRIGILSHTLGIIVIRGTPLGSSRLL